MAWEFQVNTGLSRTFNFTSWLKRSSLSPLTPSVSDFPTTFVASGFFPNQPPDFIYGLFLSAAHLF